MQTELVELTADALDAVGGGAVSDAELNPPTAVDYIWSGQGPIYQDLQQAKVMWIPGQL